MLTDIVSKEIRENRKNKDLTHKERMQIVQNYTMQEVWEICKTLYNEGMERIETKDKDFDPNLMECVSVQEGTDNKVLEEVRPGFKINDTVLRPAQVIVGGQKN